MGLFYQCSTTSNEENVIAKSEQKENIVNQGFVSESTFDTIIRIKNENYKIIITKSFHSDSLNGLIISVAKVKIIKNDSFLISKKYDKYVFAISDTAFLNRANLYNFSFTKFDFKRKQFELFAAIGVPESDWSYAYEIYIDLLGNETKKELIGEID